MKLIRESDTLKAERLLKEVHAQIEKIKSWQRVFAWRPVVVSPTESVWLEYYWRRSVAYQHQHNSWRFCNDWSVGYIDGDPLRPFISPPYTVLIESCSEEEYQAKHAPNNPSQINDLRSQ